MDWGIFIGLMFVFGMMFIVLGVLGLFADLWTSSKTTHEDEPPMNVGATHELDRFMKNNL